MKKTIKGVVSTGNPFRDKKARKKGLLWLGNVDLLKELMDHHNKKVKFELNHTVFTGNLTIDLGFNNSSYPNETDFFMIGKIDMTEILLDLVGKRITIKVEVEKGVE